MVKIPDIDESKSLIEQTAQALPYATNIILQSLMNLSVNRDLVKDAKFAVNTHLRIKTLEKEEKKVNNADRRFNFKVLELYGAEEDKKKVKSLISKSITKMKFIEE